MKTVMICCASLALLGQPQEGTNEGSTIRGHVYDHSGKPVSDANIVLFPLETVISGPRLLVRTSAQGAYALQAPALGKTRILAEKEGDGFPDPTGSLFTSENEKYTEVALVAGQTYRDVDVHLPPADGTVSGSVLDGVTGAQIPGISISLRWRDDASRFYRSSQQSSSFTFALPPRPIEMDISAGGYLPWHTELTLRAEQPSTGTPREVRVLTIRLQPKAASPGNKDSGKQQAVGDAGRSK